jgi:hypothetical protein
MSIPQGGQQCFFERTIHEKVAVKNYFFKIKIQFQYQVGKNNIYN